MNTKNVFKKLIRENLNGHFAVSFRFLCIKNQYFVFSNLKIYQYLLSLSRIPRDYLSQRNFSSPAFVSNGTNRIVYNFDYQE